MVARSITIDLSRVPFSFFFFPSLENNFIKLGEESEVYSRT